MMNKPASFRAAIAIWLTAFAVVGVLVLQNPEKRTVTKVYHKSVQNWVDRQPLYTDCGNLNYFPPFTVLFMPFHFVPPPAGDLLWRLVSLCLLVWGLARLAARMSAADGPRLFLCMSLLALLPVLGSIRNGQTNLIFSALLVHAAASLAGSRWWSAAVAMVLMTLIKPTGLVVILLAPFVYPRLLPRLCLLLPAGLLIPFLFGPPHYVLAQYRDSVLHLYSCSMTVEHRFADFNGLLRSFSISLPAFVSLGLRILAGIFTLAFWYFAGRSSAEPVRAMLLLAVSAVYLMLFNPMTETNSYAIAAPALAAWSAASMLLWKRPWLGRVLALMVISLAVLPEAFRRMDPGFGLWWDPLMMLFFAGVLAWNCCQPARV